jgi:hypothetical protein
MRSYRRVPLLWHLNDLVLYTSFMPELRVSTVEPHLVRLVLVPRQVREHAVQELVVLVRLQPRHTCGNTSGHVSHVASRHATSAHATSGHAATRHATPRHVTSRQATSGHVRSIRSGHTTSHVSSHHIRL